ncbi:MAG: hypothetical protein QOH12_813 [Solirubrobacteraceae bacterium]|jgi:hypothetical protein|nr:hypothetical protein [Solirubrobacteraceae bacterium]
MGLAGGPGGQLTASSHCNRLRRARRLRAIVSGPDRVDIRRRLSARTAKRSAAGAETTRPDDRISPCASPSARDRVGDKAAADAERPAACGFVSEPVPKWSFGTCSHRDDLRALGCGSARRSRRRAERESAHQTPRPTRAAPGEGRRSVHYAPTCQLVPGGRPWVAPHGGHVSGGGRPHRCTALLACIEAARSVGSTARGCRQQIPPVKSGWFRRTVGPGSGVNVGTYPVPFRG